jgi:hypothetical protein
VHVLRRLPGMTAALAFPVAACLLFPAAGLAVASVAGSLAAGDWRTYRVLAANHLLTLGWGTLVAMGALHQMFPAMVGVSSKPGAAAALHFGLSGVGVAAVLWGFLTEEPAWVAVGGAAVVVSVAVLAGLLAQLVARRRRWSPAVTGVCLSLLHLALAVAWGFSVALNWNLKLWPALYTYAGIGLHAAFGLVGWFGQLVVSVSYYLLPRFTGVRTVPEGRLVPILVLLNTAVALFALGAAWQRSEAARLAALLLSLAAGFYVRDLSCFLRGARQRSPDLTNWHWWAIAGQTVLAAALGGGWAAGLLPAEGRRVAASVGVLLLCGWVTLAIMGQLYKVTPFLMWYYRYARGLSAYEVPRLPAPYFPRWGAVAFALTAAGSALLALAVALTQPSLARVAGGLFAVGSAVYAGGIVVSWLLGVLLRPERAP